MAGVVGACDPAGVVSMTSPARGAANSPWRRWALPLVGILVVVGVLAAVVIGGPSLPGGSSGSPGPAVSPTASTTAGPSYPEETRGAATPTAASSATETSVFDLEVGHCFSVESDELETVVVVDCQEPHEYEVFSVLDHEAGPDAAFPGDQALLEYADAACQPPFEAFVGHDYQTSIWFITALSPSEQTWADGDREIVCTLDQQDANAEPITVTGSAEGAAE